MHVFAIVVSLITLGVVGGVALGWRFIVKLIGGDSHEADNSEDHQEH